MNPHDEDLSQSGSERSAQDDQALSQLIRSRATRYQMPRELRLAIDEALPDSTAEVPPAASRPVTRWRVAPWMPAGMSFAAGILITLLVLPLWQSQTAGGNEFTDSHVRSLLASHLMDVVSTDQHTVKPWFLGKLDYAPPVHDLAAAGYPLVGGRLDVIGGQDVAALIFKRNKHIINLFVFPEDRAEQVNCQSAFGFQAESWRAQGMRWCAISDLNDAELKDFAHLQQVAG